MARTVSSTLDLPNQTSWPHSEIADDNSNDSGWQAIALACNTILEAYKGSLVADAGDAIYTDAAAGLYYRVPLQGEPSTDDQVDAWAYGRGNGGNCTLRLSSVAGSGSTNVTASTAAAWYNIGQIAIADNGSGAGYEDLLLDCTAGTPDFDSVDIFYERAQSTLPAVASAQDAYPDGTIPADEDAYAGGEEFLAPQRVVDLSDGVQACFVRRWPICATAWESTSGIAGPTTRPFRGEVPPTMSPQTLTAHVWVRATGTSITALDHGSISLAVDGLEVTVSAVVIQGSTAWYLLEVDVDAPAETAERPVEQVFELTIGDKTTITSLCAWWEGVAYG